MRFHVLKVLSFFGNTEQIDAFHAMMFHGCANRGGAKPTSQNHRLGFDVDRPLTLHKNAYQIANIFAPEFCLVVSSVVRSALKDIANIEFQPVTFETLFSYPYQAGDFSFWDTVPDYYQQQQLFERQQHAPELIANVGEFYELAAPAIKDLRGSFADLQKVTIDGCETELDPPFEVTVSEEMLNQVPVISCGPFIMNDEIFRRISSFIDWTYFTHTERNL